MKYAIHTVLYLILTLSLTAQVNLRGSWALSNNEDNKVYTAYFVSDNQVFIKTAMGVWESSYQTGDNQLTISNQEFEFNSLSDGAYEFGIPSANKRWYLKPAPHAPSFEAPISVEAAPQGVYYRLDSSYISTYHYYRFYASGDMLHVQTTLSPDEIAPYLNRAYFSHSEDPRGYYYSGQEQEENVIAYERVLSEDSRQQFQFEFDDTIRLTMLRHYRFLEKTWTSEYILQPLDVELATWQGGILREGQFGFADDFLPIAPLPPIELVLKVTEQMPRFPGCEELADMDERKKCAQNELLKFIYRNIQYPTIARENGVEGTVVVTFVVEKDGSISNARIAREIGGGCGEESLRVVNLMRDQGIHWIPGQLFGEAVRVQFNLPVKFRLEGGTQKKRRRGRG